MLGRWLLAGTLLLVGLTGIGWQWFSAPPNPRSGHVVVLPEGSGTLRIGQILKESGSIRSEWPWLVYVWVRGWQNDLKAGTYKLPPGRALTEIAAQIHSGETLSIRYTIPEGWNLTQMARYFEERGYFSSTAFLALTSGPTMLRPAWLPANLDRLEGFLYPDTYELSADQAQPRAVVLQMLQGFERTALPLYRAEPSPSLSLDAWVTLASIIEKEAAVPTERGQISGVFTNRLQQNIPLGSDPTVEYAFNIRQTADRPLTFKQVRRPSPYNTYLNAGLPPTPIASPGLASLKAALKPEASPYLYFVARYDGTHIFSRTEAEHERAKQQIRAQRRSRPAEAELSQPSGRSLPATASTPN